MKRKEYTVTISASQEKVWEVLWSDETYRKWTAPFAEGSYAETDWKEGSKVLFLGPNGNGMISGIKTRNEPTYMSIEHLGIIVDGKKDTSSEEVKDWAGAMENYTLEEKDGKTKLTVEVDIAEAYLNSFEKAFPKALQIVKELSE
ncbi:SRPBCC family protein [Marixanthomonas ophiurae]|uniref:SRPBCC domain-containing protein n=1 Tax=Marixanthomonas ophiurae TaxID=387659 RepID=A0A3E1QCR3_9FLAO|nr:SRPBCC domain-containing protein [Marixanthomonas ophiurae]RFN59940.1 SRPBCC domain-containing protein [Marixanthomonas ophiurae]